MPSAVGFGKCPAGDDIMDVRMIGHLTAPGVQQLNPVLKFNDKGIMDWQARITLLRKVQHNLLTYAVP